MVHVVLYDITYLRHSGHTYTVHTPPLKHAALSSALVARTRKKAISTVSMDLYGYGA